VKAKRTTIRKEALVAENNHLSFVKLIQDRDDGGADNDNDDGEEEAAASPISLSLSRKLKR